VETKEETAERLRDPEKRSRGKASSLAFHPVIDRNLVLWADARYVNGHDLLTGKRVFRCDLLEDGKIAPEVLGETKLSEIDLRLPARADLRYTLSVAEGRVYARLGSQGFSPRRVNNNGVLGGPPDKRNSYLICLALQADAKVRQKWLVASNTLDTGAMELFEGAPLVVDGRAYAVLSRLEVGQTKSWIVCYEAERTGAPLWRQQVCETRAGQEPAADGRRYRHHLLTLAGTNVVYCSHAGAIVAVDAVTGKPAWAMRYPSRGPQTEDGDPSPRDLAPCMYANGIVYASPLDSDRLFCLNADTGRLVWEWDRIETVHLLGVSEERLIFATPTGIRAVGAADKDRSGWFKPDEGKLPPFGRGLLGDGWVYDPVAGKRSLLAVKVEDGTPDGEGDTYDPTQFHRMNPGNMAFGNGCLAVAGTEFLSVYVPEERFLSRRKAEARKKDAPASAVYRLALAEAGAGHYRDALSNLVRMEKMASTELYHGRPLRRLARRAHHELLLKLARIQETQKQWDTAAAALQQAAGHEFSVPARLRAFCSLARMWTAAQRPDRAVAGWQAILGDTDIRHVQVNWSTGPPQAAWRLAATRIREMIQEHGESVYQSFEAKAAKLLKSADESNPLAVLQLLSHEYPNASVTGPSLLRLAKLHEQAGHPLHAAHAYRLAIAFGRAPPLKFDDLIRARAGLARAYESQRCWEAARRAWQDLARFAGNRRCAALDDNQTVRSFVGLQLEKPAYVSLARAETLRLSLPLRRTWATSRDSPAGRLLVPEQVDWPEGKEVVLLVFGREPHIRVSCREASTGKVRWQHQFRHPVTWAGLHGDGVLLGGARGIHNLSLTDGQTAWEFVPYGLPSITDSSPRPGQLSAFRLTRTRLFCLQDECRLLAFEVQSGRVVWSHWAPAASLRPAYPAGRFLPCYHADDSWAVAQTGAGKQLVIDSEKGRIVHESVPLGSGWRQRPLALDERRICLVPSVDRVVLFDPKIGKNLWTYKTARLPGSTTPTGEPPYILGNRETLLVVVPRNVGYQLVRLDLRTGRPVWKGKPRLLRGACAAEQVSFDRRAVYYTDRKILCARSLASGKLLWCRPLGGPDGDWRTTCIGGTVVAYAARPTATPRWYWVPLGGMLLALPLRVHKEEFFPVVCCDARDGQLMQRLNLPGPVTEARVQIMPQRMLVEVEGRVWAFDGAANARLR
jgi:outer membrane protein assembly factor BamB